MHDLNLRLFYKTKFDVCCVEGGDALWHVLMAVRGWIVNKWKRRGTELPWDNPTWSAFKTGSEIVSENGVVRMRSKAYFDGDTTEWACTITEMEHCPPYAQREWVSEIGFEDNGHGAGTLSLVLSWGDRPGYFGPCAPEPTPTVPNLVRRMIRNPNLSCTLDGESLSLVALDTSAQNAEKLARHLLDPAREAPVVVMAPLQHDAEAPVFPVDPETLETTLGPGVPIYTCRNRAAVAALNAALGNTKWRIQPGMIRVYQGKPRHEKTDDHVRHRFFTRGQIDELGTDEVLAILRRTLAADVNFYETMVRVPDVDRKIRLSKIDKGFRKLRASNAQAQEDAVELAAEIEEELDLAMGELERAKTRILELQQENFALSWAPEHASRPEPASKPGLPAWPMKATQIADVFLDRYPDRLAFTDRARKSLEECRTAPDVLWNALHDLAEIAWDLFRTPGTDVARAFNDRSTFEYARGAGSMTRKDSGLIAAYKDVWQGREIDVQPHLKNGARESDPKFIRVYFAYDVPSGRIVVSHVGKHLDTYGTRGLK
jgi:hypothetical protein